MTITKKIWPKEPHTEAKHYILSEYLKAWFPILCRFSDRIIYIDGFAGPGKYEDGEVGSPLIVLDIVNSHTIPLKCEIKFLFIEENKKRHNLLQELVKGIELPPKQEIFVVNGKFKDEVQNIFDTLDKRSQRLAPCFMFIDPFGYSHTPFSLIKKAMSYDKCEILITFMYDFINRFIFEKDKEEVFNELFGTNDWINIRQCQNPEERKEFIKNLYISQLKEEADAKYVIPFEMINKHNHTVYFLIFATNSIDGLRKMKEAMWKTDETGEFTFSDIRDPNQTVLFQKSPNFIQLKKLILHKFKGKKVSIEELEEFTLAETPYRETHLRKPILIPMEIEEPPSIIVTNRKRRKSYPKGCIITFLDD